MAGKILRKKKNKDFVILDTTCLKDKNLSFKAKGLHSYLMQLPDDWEINISDLKNRSKDGRDSVSAAMNELIAAGYVHRQLVQNEKGIFEGYDYDVFERPETAVSVYGKPVNGSAVNGKPVTIKDYSKLELSNEELSEDITANAAEPEKENSNIPLKAKKEKTDTPGPRGAAKIRTGRKDHTFTQTFELLKTKNAYAHTFFLNNPDIWDSVMRYRIEINSKFASAESEAIAMVKFWKDCNGRRENAEAMIEKTVSAGYKGFFPVENKQQTTRPQTGHPNGVNPYTY